MTLESIPRDTVLFVSFSNKHYADFMLNWSKHLTRLQVSAAWHIVRAGAFIGSAHAVTHKHVLAHAVRCTPWQMAHIVVPFDNETEQLCRQHGIVLMPYDTKLEAE